MAHDNDINDINGLNDGLDTSTADTMDATLSTIMVRPADWVRTMYSKLGTDDKDTNTNTRTATPTESPTSIEQVHAGLKFLILTSMLCQSRKSASDLYFSIAGEKIFIVQPYKLSQIMGMFRDASTAWQGIRYLMSRVYPNPYYVTPQEAKDVYREITQDITDNILQPAFFPTKK